MCSFGVRSIRNSIGASKCFSSRFALDVPEHDLVALGDRCVAELVSRVAVRRKCSTGHADAEHLLDAGRQQLAVLEELAVLVGVLEQVVHPVRDEVAGRLVAGDREQHEERVELEVVELVAVDLGVDERR